MAATTCQKTQLHFRKKTNETGDNEFFRKGNVSETTAAKQRRLTDCDNKQKT